MSTKALCIYKKTEPLHLLAVEVYRKKYDAIDIIEVSALDDSVGTDSVGDLIRALTNDSYDEAYIMTTVTDGGGASGVMNYDSFAAIRNKMKTASKGTEIATGTSQAGGSTSTIKLAAGSSAVDDFYNGYILDCTGGTGAANVDKTILDYTGSSLVAEVGGATFTDPGADTTYVIYDVSTYIKTMATTGGKSVALQAWEASYPNITPPLVIHYTGTYNFTEDYGTAAAVAAGTLTLKAAPKNTGARVATAERTTNDHFNSMYAYIYSSTTGARQYRQISDFVGSSLVCTLASNWTVTPTGTVVYRVVDQVADIYADVQCEFFLKTLMYDLTDATVLSYYDKLLDNNGKLSTLTSGAPEQDLDFLSEMRIKGDVAWQYSLL